jgi:hypothetical protein
MEYGGGKIRHPRQADLFNDEVPDREFDVSPDSFDDEEAIDRGMSPREAAFIMGFFRNRKII